MNCSSLTDPAAPGLETNVSVLPFLGRVKNIIQLVLGGRGDLYNTFLINHPDCYCPFVLLTPSFPEYTNLLECFNNQDTKETSRIVHILAIDRIVCRNDLKNALRSRKWAIALPSRHHFSWTILQRISRLLDWFFIHARSNLNWGLTRIGKLPKV